MKRRLTVDSDEDYEYGESEEYAKRPKTQQQQQRQRSLATTTESAEEDAGELDVETDEPSTMKKVSRGSIAKSKAKHHLAADTDAPAAAQKKKRPLAASEPETED